MAWLTGWQHRKSHLILAAAGAGTGYQTCIKVYKTTGTDGTETISGTTAGKVYVGSQCRDDFGDIRFTDDDGTTLLSYWMESYVSGTSAIFWVKVNDDLTNNQTIYVYYEKSDATSISDITTTWNFGDDFESGFLNSLTIQQAAHGSIVKVGLTYYMFFAKWGGVYYSSIRIATSSDLVTWVDTGEIIANRTSPAILQNADISDPTAPTYNSKYWLICKDTGDGNYELYSANAITGPWSYEKDVLSPSGGAGDWDNSLWTESFIYDGEIYYIWYQGYKNADSKNRIGYASTSTPDGSYTKAIDNPRIEPTVAWEGNSTGDPIARKEGSTYYIFFTGNAGASCYNSYATGASMAGAWTKSGVYLTPQGISYPEITKHTNGLYYMNEDNLNSSPTDKHCRQASFIIGPYSGRWTFIGAGWSADNVTVWKGIYSAKGSPSADRLLSKTLSSAQTSGRILVWFRCTDVTYDTYLLALNNGTTLVCLPYQDHFKYHDGAWKNFPNDQAALDNTWYRVECIFDWDIDKFKVWVNSNYAGEVTTISAVSIAQLSSYSYSGGSPPILHLDDYCIGKCVYAGEPVHSTWGVEESGVYNAVVTVTEIIGVLDTKSRSKTINRTITELLGLMDTKSRIKIIYRAITELLGLTDTKSRNKITYRTIIELLGLKDSKTRTKTIYRTYIELIGLKDIKSRVKSYFRIVTEKLGLKDVKSMIRGKFKTVTEIIGLKDTRSKIKTIRRTITERIGLKDTQPFLPPVVIAVAGKIKHILLDKFLGWLEQPAIDNPRVQCDVEVSWMQTNRIASSIKHFFTETITIKAKVAHVFTETMPITAAVLHEFTETVQVRGSIIQKFEETVHITGDLMKAVIEDGFKVFGEVTSLLEKLRELKRRIDEN